MPLPMQKDGSPAKPNEPPKKNVPLELTAYGTTPLGKPRLFVCQVCTRAFARLEHLRRHERSHTKEKPFLCGVCQRKFSRRDLLLRHAQKLHAGCSDAITRLRRKSIKRMNRGEDDDEDDDEEEEEEEAGGDSVPPNFNLDLFHGRQNGKFLQYSSARNSISETPRQPKRSSRRGASFLAQSGANYASGLPDLAMEYPHPENVEFSTPQMLPSSMNDEMSWLNQLSGIPGMNAPPERNGLTYPPPTYQNPGNGTGLLNGLNGINSLGSLSNLLPNSLGTLGPLNSMQPSYMMPTATISNQELQQGLRGAESYGYSFYDVDESQNLNLSSSVNLQTQQPRTNKKSRTQSNQPQPTNTNFDLDFLNDMDELTHEIDAGAKFLPNGYFFYGEPLPSTGQNSGPDVSDFDVNLYENDLAGLSNGHGTLANNVNGLIASSSRMNSAIERLSVQNTTPSKLILFTASLRNLIHRSLEKYPISGIMSPSIPTNDKLQLYTTTFSLVFLSHFPFIHPSKLNEAEIMAMTRDEDPKNESARVCLPLLVATVGALLTNNKYDLEHLYEALRRTIHIYLESRKNALKDREASVNPLWLIQSLTLSVIYGLFSDNENNVYIVIRQLNALNLLVKTSIKSGREVLFSMHDTEGTSDALRFERNINAQSQTRIVFMIYRLTNFLLMMYNVPLTLSVHDLQGLVAVDRKDEILWGYNSYGDWVANSRHGFGSQPPTPQPHQSLDYYLHKEDPVVYRKLLTDLIATLGHSQQGLIPSQVSLKLNSLSNFAFICIVHGVYELQQYDAFDAHSVLDAATTFMPSIAQGNQNHERLDYALLVNFTKISLLIDFRQVKEQSWLRNVDDLTRNYATFLLTDIPETDYLKVVDCCLTTVKLILFKTEDTPKSPHENGAPFEKLLGIRVSNEFDNSTNLIHSQMLFHVFAILAAFLVYILKKNRTTSTSQSAHLLFELNHRFAMVLELLDRVERFLRVQYKSTGKLDSFFGNVYGKESLLEKTLYILKVGEVVLNYLFDSNIKVSIFNKLGSSLSEIRRFLSENEGVGEGSTSIKQET